MSEERNLLSLELLSLAPNIELEEPQGIWETLRRAIENQVRKDGIKKDAILSAEIEADVFKRAVDYIYDDVSEFYYWIFDNEDEFGRFQYVLTQPTQGGRFAGRDYNTMRKAVEPVVEDNLDAMREADEITPEQDVEGLSEKITDDLTAYIMNWQNWFYERKSDDDIDAYYEYMAEHASVYDEEYRDMTNGVDNSQYDGESDVPHLS
jgi:hypothetical protein